MKKFTLCLNSQEMEAIKTSPHTRLYLRRIKGDQITFETSRPSQLARDLEKVIDFGAITASEVLGI